MLEVVPVAVGRALRRARAGEDKLTNHRLVAPGKLDVESSAFDDGDPIPARYTADGRKISPPITFRGVPADARAVVVMVEDADSPSREPLVHAIVWRLPGRDGDLHEGALASPGSSGEGYALGRNSFWRTEYLPPDPPPGHGPHRYAFQVFALDAKLGFAHAPGRSALLRAMHGHVLAQGTLIGTYER